MEVANKAQAGELLTKKELITIRSGASPWADTQAPVRPPLGNSDIAAQRIAV